MKGVVFFSWDTYLFYSDIISHCYVCRKARIRKDDLMTRIRNTTNHKINNGVCGYDHNLIQIRSKSQIFFSMFSNSLP